MVNFKPCELPLNVNPILIFNITKMGQISQNCAWMHGLYKVVKFCRPDLFSSSPKLYQAQTLTLETYIDLHLIIIVTHYEN